MRALCGQGYTPCSFISWYARFANINNWFPRVVSFPCFLVSLFPVLRLGFVCVLSIFALVRLVYLFLFLVFPSFVVAVFLSILVLFCFIAHCSFVFAFIGCLFFFISVFVRVFLRYSPGWHVLRRLPFGSIVVRTSGFRMPNFSTFCSCSFLVM